MQNDHRYQERNDVVNGPGQEWPEEEDYDEFDEGMDDEGYWDEEDE